MCVFCLFFSFLIPLILIRLNVNLRVGIVILQIGTFCNCIEFLKFDSTALVFAVFFCVWFRKISSGFYQNSSSSYVFQFQYFVFYRLKWFFLSFPSILLLFSLLFSIFVSGTWNYYKHLTFISNCMGSIMILFWLAFMPMYEILCNYLSRVIFHFALTPTGIYQIDYGYTVAIVMPLPNPDDPKQHEACCVYCKNDLFFDLIFSSLFRDTANNFQIDVICCKVVWLPSFVTFHDKHIFSCATFHNANFYSRC